MKLNLTHGWALAALLTLGLVTSQAQEKSVEALQKEALALNSVRSEEAIAKKLKEISDDKKYARQLVQAAALLLPKKEENTFTHSAAHILGVTAYEARENKAAIDFLLID